VFIAVLLHQIFKQEKMKRNSILVLGFVALMNLSTYAQKEATLIIKGENTIPNYADDNGTAKVAMSVSKAILEGNWEKLDAMLDDNYTYTGDGNVFTKDQYIGYMQSMRSAFSDFEMILEKTLVDKDMASINFTANVVNTGSFSGAPANKKHISVHGMFMRSVKDGKVMQEWQTTDLLGTMKQIGGGSLFFYAVFVGGCNVKQEIPPRLPNDFMHIDGKVSNYDKLSAKEKNKYVKKYKNDFEKKLKK